MYSDMGADLLFFWGGISKMPRILIAAVTLAAAMASPAQAALILDKTGPVSEIFQYYEDPSDTFAVALHHIVGPNTIGPNFSTPPLFTGTFPNNQPTNPWSYNGPITQYVIKLTTPAPLENARGQAWNAFFLDSYMSLDGGWVKSGGDDNNGNMFNDCNDLLACSPLQTLGNVTTLSFKAQDVASWGPGGDGLQVFWQWFNRAEIQGSLPDDALDGAYRVQVFASAVPEPAAWMIMIMGFGAVGCVLRVWRRSGLTPANC